MGVAEIATEVNSKLDAVRVTLDREVTGKGDVCLTCSFQAEDVLLAKLAIALDPRIPVLFLDTGYHFAETYAYRDRIAVEWELNLINLLPEKTVLLPDLRAGCSLAASIGPGSSAWTSSGTPESAIAGIAASSCRRSTNFAIMLSQAD